MRFPICSALVAARKVSRRGLSLTSTSIPTTPPRSRHRHPLPAQPDELLAWEGLGVGGILSFLARLIRSSNFCGGEGRGGEGRGDTPRSLKPFH